MNFKVTAGLLVVLVGLGTYVALYEREPKDPAAEASKSPDEVQVLKYDLADMKGFAVTTSDAAMEATRTKGDWHLVAGDTKLDTNGVETPLRSLQDLKSRRLISAAATDKEKADFGLDKPQATLAFKWRDPKDNPAALLLGKESLDKSGYYVTTKPGKSIYLIDRYALDSLAALAKKPPLAGASPSPQAK